MNVALFVIGGIIALAIIGIDVIVKDGGEHENFDEDESNVL